MSRGRGRGRGGGGALGHGSALLNGLSFDEIKGQARTAVTYPPAEKDLETAEASRTERKMAEANDSLIALTQASYTLPLEGLPKPPRPKFIQSFEHPISKDHMSVELWNTLFEPDQSVRDALKKNKKAKSKGKRSEHSKDLLDKVADGETKVDPAGDKSGSEADEEEGSDAVQDAESEEEDEDDYGNNYFDNGEDDDEGGGNDEGGVMD